MDHPVISVITVCFNAEKHIAQTIESVLRQTYPAIEYIIIDGASTDGTLRIIEKYKDRMAVIVSEKDKGLYDAMNKGLQAATGDYALFLNADDVLYAEDTLEMALQSCSGADVIYGEAMLIDEAGREIGLRSEKTPQKVPEKLNWKSLRYGMVVSHQAFIVRRELAPLYDLRYKICADIDWMITCLKNASHICHSHEVISKFRVGGASRQQQKRAWKERFYILQKHYGMVNNFFNHIYVSVRYLLSPKH